MLFYFIITMISALLMHYIQRKNKRVWIEEKGIYQITRNKYLYIIPFIPLLLVSALRYGIGTDYFYTYYPTFFRIRNGYPLGHSFELGYLLLNKFVAVFSDDVTWVIAICAFLFFVFIGKAIIEQSENPTLSIMLLVGTGFYAFSMNGMRQAIVIAIWIYSMKYIKQQRFRPYLIWMLLSGLFHTSGLLMIPFYFVYQIKITPKTAMLSIAGTVAFASVFKKLILYTAMFTKYYNKFIGTSQIEGDFAYSTFGILIAVLLYLLILYKPLRRIWEYNFFLISTTFGVICSILTKDIYIIARLLSIFQYMPAFYFPLTLRVFEGKSKKIVSLVVVFMFFLYIWFMADYLGKGETVPYQSIFNR